MLILYIILLGILITVFLKINKSLKSGRIYNSFESLIQFDAATFSRIKKYIPGRLSLLILQQDIYFRI